MSTKKKPRERSPKYVIIGLAEALERVKVLYNKEGRNSIAREIAVNTMGYKGLSGRALQILSSLFQFGLLDRSTGKVSVSDAAFTILKAPEGNRDRNLALSDVALSPQVFKDIKNEYPDSLPSDENVKWFLQQKQFSEKAAETIIQCFRETITLAKVYDAEYNIDEEQNTNEQEIQEPSVNTSVQNTENTSPQAIKWTFPFGEKTASLSIQGGKPKQEEMTMLIAILEAFKNTLPSRKEEE